MFSVAKIIPRWKKRRGCNVNICKQSAGFRLKYAVTGHEVWLRCTWCALSCSCRWAGRRDSRGPRRGGAGPGWGRIPHWANGIAEMTEAEGESGGDPQGERTARGEPSAPPEPLRKRGSDSSYWFLNSSIYDSFSTFKEEICGNVKCNSISSL